MILRSLYRALLTLLVLEGTLFAQGNALTAPAMASAWEEIALPEQPRPTVDRLLRAPGNPEVLYAPTDQGAWRSVDGGGSWERLGVMRPWAGFLRTYLVDAVDPFLLYTINWNGYPARSWDGGMSWQTLKEAVLLLAADPVRSGRLYGAAEDGGLVISEDRGETWSPSAVDPAGFVAVNPAYPQYVGLPGVPYSVLSLVLDPRDPDQYYAVVRSWVTPVSLLHSADAGSHGEEVALPEIGPPIGTVVFDRRGQIYAGASRFLTAFEGYVVPGFFFSPGDGQEWV